MDEKSDGSSGLHLKERQEQNLARPGQHLGGARLSQASRYSGRSSHVASGTQRRRVTQRLAMRLKICLSSLFESFLDGHEGEGLAVQS